MFRQLLREYFAEIMPGDEYLKDPGQSEREIILITIEEKNRICKKPGKQPLSGHFPKKREDPHVRKGFFRSKLRKPERRTKPGNPETAAEYMHEQNQDAVLMAFSDCTNIYVD